MGFSKSAGDPWSASDVNTLPQIAANETITGAWTFSGFVQFTRSVNNEPSVRITHSGTHSAPDQGILEIVGDSDDNNVGIIFDYGFRKAFMGILKGQTVFSFRTDIGGTPDTPLLFRNTGGVVMGALATSDPGFAGELWNDGGTVKVSAG